ncbi:MAG: M48 family metalloprotease [Candidatus Lindowbacteria bacterium]|nr:M48 family metalloprotease [Candidatus Lindowbacteria bacterium]
MIDQNDRTRTLQSTRLLSRVFYVFITITLVFTTSCSQKDHLAPHQTNVWLVSEKREIAVGNEVAEEVERQFPVYEDQELTDYINRIGQSLARASDRPPRGNLKYTFKVLDSPIANAFATPGGHIYITRGILAVFENESQLAGVIGHEVGHVAARHSAKRMQAGTFAQIGLLAVLIGGGDKVNPDMYRALNLSAQLIFLGYSRSDEHQSDLLGAKYLYRTGYDPEGMVGGLEGLMSLQKRSPLQAEQYFRSHPLTRDRIEHLRSWLPRIPKEDVWGGTPPGTKLLGVETYKRIAAPHAQFQGGDEMLAAIENFRVAMNRRQIDLAEKSLSKNFMDDQGRNRSKYLTQLQNLFNNSKSISYTMENVVTEASRDGGAAKYDYKMKRKTGDGRVMEEEGRVYLEFLKPAPFVWKISSIRMVRI